VTHFLNNDDVTAMNGALCSPDISYTGSTAIQNLIACPVSIYVVDYSCTELVYGVVAPQASFVIPVSNCWVILRDQTSNAYIACFFAAQGDNVVPYEIQGRYLFSSGDIGPCPTPTASVLVPPDSPRVVVGCGTTKNGFVLRYQYWAASAESFTVAPGAERTFSVTTVKGMTSTSSSIETIAQSLSASASAGWGPISASLAYSLSQLSSSTQSYSVEESTTKFETMTISNTDTAVAMYLAWQMMDVIQVCSISGSDVVVQAEVVSARMPVIYVGPYDPSNPPAPASPIAARYQTALPVHIASAAAFPRSPVVAWSVDDARTAAAVAGQESTD
jgi:hypothetical protein